MVSERGRERRGINNERGGKQPFIHHRQRQQTVPISAALSMSALINGLHIGACFDKGMLSERPSERERENAKD